MYLLNLLGVFLESCFPDSWLELQGVTVYKKAYEVIKITVVSVLHSFQLGFRCICPFPYFSERYQISNKRYHSIETVSLLVTAHLNLSKAFASICPSILLNKLHNLRMP